MARIDPLAGTDLNLWVLFRAMYKERNVHRAARAVGLSASAASHSLGRLRTQLGDELFVRSGGRMVPTPRADALAGPVARSLAEIEAALGPAPDFDPASATGVFKIAAMDLAQVLLMPELLTRFATRAPQVQVLVIPTPDRPARDLAQGDLDLALGGLGREEGLVDEVLIRDRFVCLVRDGHPCRSGPVSAEAYAALPHVVVNSRRVLSGFVDAALEAVGLTRRVVCVAPGLELAGNLVSRTDLVLTTVERGARWAAARYPLSVFEAPLPIAPYALIASWHPRRTDDPLHRWVRNELLHIVHEIELAD